jgi:hypothetical protein
MHFVVWSAGTFLPARPRHTLQIWRTNHIGQPATGARFNGEPIADGMNYGSRFKMLRCYFCVTHWVDRAIELAGVELAGLARRRLIGGLLSRPHLILSGSAGVGKVQLARALALAGVDGQSDRICWIQGHPWWAADTTDVGHFVELQTDFSLWRLALFANTVLNDGAPIRSPVGHPAHVHARVGTKAPESNGDRIGACRQVACVERMSPVEIELYFGVVARWLVQNGGDGSGPLPLRLVGTYDSLVPPVLDEQIGRLVVVVHLQPSIDLDDRGQRVADDVDENRLLTCP